MPSQASSANQFVTNRFAVLHGDHYSCIQRFDELDPFLMSVTSDDDLWMYCSSTGALTAGRCSEDRTLFPYETDDKLAQAQGITGPVTLIRVWREGAEPVLWEPFARHHSPDVTRNLYKTDLGHRVLFEETYPSLGLIFRYRWAPCSRYGFVRTCWLELEAGAVPVQVELMDGLVNLLPGGVDLAIQQSMSCLINAYSQSEVDAETGLGIFAMSSRLVDKAEPAEALAANVVWSYGLPQPRITLAREHLELFRRGQSPTPQTYRTGRRGAYLIQSQFVLQPGEPVEWHVVADANQEQRVIAALRQNLRQPKEVPQQLSAALEESDANLRRLVGAADGLQQTGDEMAGAHHSANVLFNIMRGGVFVKGYQVRSADFALFLQQHSKDTATRNGQFLQDLPQEIAYGELLKRAGATNDVDLERLVLEYLPLTFSRRHGDPSRPWNRFAIRVRKEDGSPAIAYQGNWRDIFQNWEALCTSYPEFIEPIIAKFVNASTADGFNPYRISREEINWEVPDPGNSWANLGYWGDHQIVYLLRLLELSERYHPGRLGQWLDRSLFSHADVPYRLKPYAEILANPHDTISFDYDAHRTALTRAAREGSDGLLVHDAHGQILKVTFLEKLLVPVLAKLSSLVLDGGIWMNTQRPEWNDANNALVGYGVSMVTLCHLRRHLVFLAQLLSKSPASEVQISDEVVEWMRCIATVLHRHEAVLAQAYTDDTVRKQMLDELGHAFGDYREELYQHGLSGHRPVSIGEVRELLELANGYAEHGIRANRRDDGLYHSYNLLVLSPDGQRAGTQTMYEMLEGQVAVLGSGLLKAEETITLLQALFRSAMYREDQRSFTLYPARKRPRFLDKGRIPEQAVSGNPLLCALLKARETSVILRDAEGVCRFAAQHSNGRILAAALDTLGQRPEYASLVKQHRQSVLATYEKIFEHRSFTGRSGAMYGYEGIGCIYWHMVAKLLLAVQECYFAARREGASPEQVQKLSEFYREIQAGLGFNKSAQQYGAFPTDPYSHTPAHSGAQQPGMTGQVKEEILCRWGELGVMVNHGSVDFRPTLLRREEFLAQAVRFDYVALDGQPQSAPLRAGELAFTLCQVPVIYRLASEPYLRLIGPDGRIHEHSDPSLDACEAAELFARTGQIHGIEVGVSLD